MATFKAGPGDRAAHGMVPADLQIKIVGMILGGFGVMMAAGCLALLVTLLSGVADAIYLAIFPAIFGLCLFVLRVASGWFGGLTFVSSILVICSAATHWFHSRRRITRAYPEE